MALTGTHAEGDAGHVTDHNLIEAALTAESAARAAAVAAEAASRVSGDAALQSSVTTNTANIATNTSSISTNTTAIANEISNRATSEALLAPKNSPALTGTPTAPTAAPGTNTTQLATTAFVVAAGGSSVPSGAAGGGLGGTYPNPTVTVVAAGAAGPLSATDATTTNSRTPTGSAGGDLTGTYPNPTLAATAVAAGTYNHATLTVDAKGRLTAASSGSITLTPTALKTAPYTAVVGDLALMNVAGGGTTLTLPTAPADKSQVGYTAIGATTGTPLVINPGGSDTLGTSGLTTASIPLSGETNVFQYQASSTRWVSIANVKTIASLDARYLGISAAIPESQVTNLTTDLAAKAQALTPTAVKTANYTAAANDLARFDTTTGTMTLTLPTAPADKTLVAGKIVLSASPVNALTINTGGTDTINRPSGVTTFSLLLLGQWFLAEYKASDGTWTLFDGVSVSQLDARYLGILTAIPESQVTNLTTDLAAKAPLASPALTGTPTAPTAAPGTNTTQLATTAFTAAAITAAGGASAGGSGIFGDGSDGNVTVSTSISLARDMLYDTLTVSAAGTIKPNGFRIYCKTAASISGALTAPGSNGVGATAGGSTSLGSVNRGGSGGAGGTGVGAGGGTTNSATGGSGAAGGTGASGAGGAGGVATAAAANAGTLRTLPMAALGILLAGQGSSTSLATASAMASGGEGGGGGGGDTTNSGGGGGGGGGVLILVAKSITVQAGGSISANGGNGAAGVAGNSGGGGGGGGGYVSLVYNTLSNAGTIQAVGGTGGTGSGTGTTGSTGSAGTVIQVVNT